MVSCYQYKGGLYAKEREGVSIVKERKGRDVQVYFGTTEKKVYQILKVVSNGTSVLCRKEGQEETNSSEL